MADSLVSNENNLQSSKDKEEGMEEKAVISPSSPLLQIESPEVQSFLRNMLEKSILSLKPVMSFERGATYPEVSQFFLGRKSETEVESFLLQLSSLGLLDKQIVDRIISCPSCKGTKVYSKYQCAKCGSFDVAMLQIIEHLLCGYIGPKTSLKDSTICPQCKQKILSEKDYRPLGKTFGCLNCLYRFETPPVVHRCEDCGNVFSFNHANYYPVYEFTISSKTREEFSSGLLSLRPVIAWLQEQGYTVESPQEVIGTSGSKHRFDIVAHTGALKNVLLGDFAFAPSDQVIIATFAKKYDVNPSAKSFVVTYTKAPKNIDAIAKIYGISIIYIGEDKMSLEEQLKRMLAGTPQVIAASKIAAPSSFYLGPAKRKERAAEPIVAEKPVHSVLRKQPGEDAQEKGISSEPVALGPISRTEQPVRSARRPSISQRNAKALARKERMARRRRSKTNTEEEDGYYFFNEEDSLENRAEENDLLILE